MPQLAAPWLCPTSSAQLAQITSQVLRLLRKAAASSQEGRSLPRQPLRLDMQPAENISLPTQHQYPFPKRHVALDDFFFEDFTVTVPSAEGDLKTSDLLQRYRIKHWFSFPWLTPCTSENCKCFLPKLQAELSSLAGTKANCLIYKDTHIGASKVLGCSENFVFSG